MYFLSTDQVLVLFNNLCGEYNDRMESGMAKRKTKIKNKDENSSPSFIETFHLQQRPLATTSTVSYFQSFSKCKRKKNNTKLMNQSYRK